MSTKSLSKKLRERVDHQSAFSQTVNIIQYHIHNKITSKCINRWNEFTVDLPSILLSKFIDEINTNRCRDNNSVIGITTYDMIYLDRNELSNIFGFDSLIKIYDNNNKQLPVRSAITKYIQSVDLRSDATLNKVDDIFNFIKIWRERELQKLLQHRLEIIKSIKEKDKDSEIPDFGDMDTMDQYDPSHCYFVYDLMIGVNIRSPSYSKRGKIKIVMNCVEYIPSENIIRGESCLLDTYLDWDQDQMAVELANHDFLLDLNERDREKLGHDAKYEILHIIPAEKVSLLVWSSELYLARRRTRRYRRILSCYV